MKTKRSDFFDGLKGLAMLFILAYYFFQHLVPGGFLAVNMFLFIAGFFNFRHFYKASTKGKKVNTWLFYKRRFNRLFFPMLAMIISVAAFILLFARDYLFNLRNMAFSALAFLNNYYQIWQNQSYFVQAANPSPFTHLWYVSLLGLLLLLTPLLVRLIFSWNKKPAVAVNFLLVISLISASLMAYWFPEGGDPTRVYYDLLTRGFAYTLGGALGFILPLELNPKPLNKKAKQLLNLISISSLVLILLMVVFMYGTQAFAYRFGMLLFTLSTAILIASAIHPETWINRLVTLKPFSYLGKRSYSIYLWYYPIYLIVPSLMGSFSSNLWLTVAIQFIVLMLLTEASYRIFEQQTISLPFGQDFNFKKARAQVRYLKKHPKGLRKVKSLTAGYLIMAFLAVIALAIAPEQKGEMANQLQEVIESNQELASSTQTEDTQNTKVVNHIEGLNQEELLYANGLEVTFIGDSVLLAAAEEIQQVFPKAVIDGEVGRQLYNSLPVVSGLASQGLLQDTVVTILGSNGTYTQSQLEDYIQAIGPDKDIFFVNVHVNRVWREDANQRLLEAAQRHGNVHIIDWASRVNDNPQWLYEDGAHPNPEGAHEFAVLIAQELYRQR
ncbi:acyltransferase family protein [Hutsoniella sourekii]|uniref:acyltransferase family protein n=1 Tax=Hutsoniella sourekii TaxID=87650 RepID=UPI000486CA85|nr:acyltransferase family protein [Hutsoniella sourekii]